MSNTYDFDSLWVDWNELRRITHNRNVYFYGKSEDWLPKALNQLGKPPKAIFDSNELLWGGDYKGIEIISPSYLEQIKNQKAYIVITTGSYDGVVDRLLQAGLRPGSDFCCTPEYRDAYYLQRIKRHSQRLLLTSPDYDSHSQGARHSKEGGGIFVAEIRDGKMHAEKVLSGQFRQIEEIEQGYITVEFNEPAVYVLNKDLSVKSKISLPRPHFCGVTVHEASKTAFVANSSTDQIYLYDMTSWKLKSIANILPKSSDKAESRHHINDVCIEDDSLFVSYFSATGFWKNSVYDGGITEIPFDRHAGELLEEQAQQIQQDLWMPHSIKFINGSLCFLESAKGRFYEKSYHASLTLPGFARGIAYSDGYYYIGMSETQYMSRVKGVLPYVLMNCGVFAYEPVNNATRFYPLPDNMNIHDILVLKD